MCSDFCTIVTQDVFIFFFAEKKFDDVFCGLAHGFYAVYDSLHLLLYLFLMFVTTSWDFFKITVVSFIRLFVTIDWLKSNVSVWHVMRLSDYSLGRFAILAALDIGALTAAQKAMKGQNEERPAGYNIADLWKILESAAYFDVHKY